MLSKACLLAYSCCRCSGFFPKVPAERLGCANELLQCQTRLQSFHTRLSCTSASPTVGGNFSSEEGQHALLSAQSLSISAIPSKCNVFCCVLRVQNSSHSSLMMCRQAPPASCAPGRLPSQQFRSPFWDQTLHPGQGSSTETCPVAKSACR